MDYHGSKHWNYHHGPAHCPRRGSAGTALRLCGSCVHCICKKGHLPPLRSNHCRTGYPVHRNGDDELSHDASSRFSGFRGSGVQLQQPVYRHTGRSRLHCSDPVLLRFRRYPSGLGCQRSYRTSNCSVRSLWPEHRNLYYSRPGLHRNQPECKAYYCDPSDV
ncbi:unknown [Clostridium sp. CAG:149]|nr:unknown [Clostridium sp. CAG:149]